jgi:hypothetical protein
MFGRTTQSVRLAIRGCGHLEQRRKYRSGHVSRELCQTVLLLTHYASQLLRECIEISQSLPDCEGQRHLARACYKLAGIFQNLEKDKESAEYIDRGRSLARDISERDSCSVEDFDSLVPWMLW